MNRRDIDRLVGEQLVLNAINATQTAFPWGSAADTEVVPEPDPHARGLTLAQYLDEVGEEIEDEATLRALLKRASGTVRWDSFPSGVRFVTLSTIAHNRRQGTPPDHLFIEQKDGTWEHTSPESFVHDITWSDRASNYLDAGEPFEDRFNREFWESPVPLYHGTNSLKTVLKRGLEPRSDTRGISNRSVGAAVFTSLNESGTESYSHGPGAGTVKIDTSAMKRDNLTPRVEQEPEVVEQEQLSAIAHRLGLEWSIEYSDAGIDPDTIIVHGFVPKQYLKPV